MVSGAAKFIAVRMRTSKAPVDTVAAVHSHVTHKHAEFIVAVPSKGNDVSTNTFNVHV
jgi:hypothetical protein